MRALREALLELIVERNLISPELANYHVARMTDAEAREQFEIRARDLRVTIRAGAGAELSVDVSA